MTNSQSDRQSDAQFEFEGVYLDALNRAIEKYPAGRKQSAVLCALDQAQRQNHQNGHYVTDAAIDTIARFWKCRAFGFWKSPVFFTMINLRPVGKFHIQLCGTTPCMLCGAEDLRHAVEAHLNIKAGQTTKDGTFTLTEVECLGACANAPMVQINDAYYEDLTPENLLTIIDNLANTGQTSSGSQSGRRGSEPQGGLTTLRDSGTPKILARRPGANRLAMMLQDKDRIFTNLYGTQSWQLADAKKRGVYDQVKPLAKKGREWLVDEVKASGLRGAAGWLSNWGEMVIYAEGKRRWAAELFGCQCR